MKTEKKATRIRKTAKKGVAKDAPTLGSASTTDMPARDPSEISRLRRAMIEEAAYFKAEHDGFRVDPLAYWLAAEKDVDGTLSASSDSGSGLTG